MMMLNLGQFIKLLLILCLTKNEKRNQRKRGWSLCKRIKFETWLVFFQTKRFLE